MATTFCTSGQALIKAGNNVNTLLISGAGFQQGATEDFIYQAESTINSLCRYNFTDVYTTGLNSDVKKILEETASNLAAIYMIQYDMSGYTTRTEAADMINILRDAVLRGLSILKDKKNQEFINGA